MKIFFTTDIHAHPSLLEQLVREVGRHRIDALIIGGDIVPHSLPQARALGLLDAQAAYLENTLVPALQRIKAQQDMDIYLDLSNDDFASSRHILEHYQGRLLHLLHMQKHALTAHVDVIGYMNVPPTPFQRKDWEKPDTVDRPYAPGARVRLKGYRTHTGRIQAVGPDYQTFHFCGPLPALGHSPGPLVQRPACGQPQHPALCGALGRGRPDAGLPARPYSRVPPGIGGRSYPNSWDPVHQSRATIPPAIRYPRNYGDFGRSRNRNIGSIAIKERTSSISP
jgi:hypothetical protein